MATVGFVGLGVMGGTSTKRLLDAGHTVHGYNRTREKAQWLVERGLILARLAARGRRAVRRHLRDGDQHAALDAVADGPGRLPRRPDAG